jgi:hypothetical protein
LKRTKFYVYNSIYSTLYTNIYNTLNLVKNK